MSCAVWHFLKIILLLVVHLLRIDTKDWPFEQEVLAAVFVAVSTNLSLS